MNDYILPRVVDEAASKYPDKLWMTVPQSGKLDQGWRDLTFKDLGRAVNNLAHWLEKTVGISHDRETLAFMSENDASYPIFLVAAIKVGYKVLLPSTRNSFEGQLSLLRNTQCSKFFHGDVVQQQVQSYKTAQSELECFQIPTVSDLINETASSDTDIDHYSHEDTDVVLILHTSGSTGFPRPIPIKNSWLGALAFAGDLPIPKGRVSSVDTLLSCEGTLFTMSPFFHAFGLGALIRSVVRQKPLVLLHSRLPPNAEMVLKALKQTNPALGMFSPSLLEEIVDAPGGLEALARMRYVFFGGAPLADEVGVRIEKVTELVSILGSTEGGHISTMVPANKKYWDCFEWVPEFGVVMEDNGDGLFELTVHRNQYEKFQGYFHTFPNVHEWRTRDLFQENPEAPGLWRYMGRKDDLLVLSNGEKVNPIAMEKHVESHPAIKGALVVGQGKFQTGILLEPDWKRSALDDPDNLIDIVWPLIEEANKVQVAYGRVWKSKILIAKRDKPFRRTPKGSIVRRETVQMYQKEIDALYSNEGIGEQLGNLSEEADIPAIKGFLHQALSLIIPTIPRDAGDNNNIFDYGADSLQVLGLSSAISNAMPRGQGETEGSVPTRIIYGNPTVEGLAKVLHRRLNASSTQEEAPNGVSHEQKIKDMVAKYTSDLPTSAKTQLGIPAKHAVVLTGSTGSLGNYILELLIADPKVELIYCLNRSPTAQTRQKESFTARGADPSFSKARFYVTDFSKDRFGLSEEHYTELSSTVDVFIHNAWPVDFNLSLETYEATHITGIRRCIDFSLAAKYRPQIFFLSSIASVGNWKASLAKKTCGRDEVPEEFFEDDTLPLSQGYGESKHVASRILAVAAAKSGVPCTIIRAGQLAGPRRERGLWNKQEWLPSIISTSKALGAIPESLGSQDVVDWVPVDAAANAVIEVVRFRTSTSSRVEAKPCDVVNLANPRTVHWKELVPAVQDFYSTKHIRAVPMTQWLDELKRVPLTPEEIADKPAVKLMDFYEGLTAKEAGLPRLATGHMEECSQTMRELKPISRELMDVWLKQWDF